MNVKTPKPATITCAATGRIVGADRNLDGSTKLPRGWKRVGGATYSPEGVQSLYRTVSIHFPIQGVLPAEHKKGDETDATENWKAFRESCRASWKDATECYNWTLVELAKLDTEPLTPGTTKDGKPIRKLPAMTDSKALYGLARIRWPGLDSQSLGSLLQRARAAYNAKRFDRRVLGKTTLPEVLYPAPVPVPAKDCKLNIDGQKQAWATVRVSGTKYRLRLRNGADMRWQLSQLAQVLGGEGVQGEALLYERRASSSNGNGGTARVQGKANQYATRVILAVSCYLPRKAGDREDQTLTVSTAKERLWSVQLDGQERPWLLNEDQVKGWLAQYVNRSERISEDRKFERRSTKDARSDLNSLTAGLAHKNHNRLADWLHKAAALLVGFAGRQKVSKIVYDDTNKDWSERFPWYKLRELVQQKATAVGIAFEHVGD